MRGEHNQNLRVFLAKNEAMRSYGDFLEIVKMNASLTPEDLKVGAVTVEGTPRPNKIVVVGEHSLKRQSQRTKDGWMFHVKEQLLSKAISILSNPLIGSEVAKHQVVWDNARREVVPLRDDKIMGTVVKLEAENVVYVFEAGKSYIRLVTMWTGNVHKFTAYNCSVVNVSRCGAITINKGVFRDTTNQKSRP